MKTTKKDKCEHGHGRCGWIVRIFSLVLAVCALVIGICDIVVMNNSTITTDYVEHCETEAYTEGSEAVENLCSDMTMYYGGLLYEQKLTQVMVMFSAAVILTLFAFSNKNRN